MKKSKLFISVFFLTAYCLLPTVSQAQYTKLLDFDSINGKYPFGDLFSDGSFLYGITQNGGTNDNGVVFKIKPDGTGYSKLLDFTGSGTPVGSLISD